MITLGGITLPDLVWEEELAWTGVEERVEYTLGGQVLVWEQAVGGRPITLTGGSDWGWITRGTLKSLRALAAAANAEYTLNYEGSLYTVRFIKSGALEASPLVPRPNAADTDYYNNVRINLMMISDVVAATTTSTTSSTT